jgi:hypothetical protein
MSKYNTEYWDKLERRRTDPDYDPPPPPAEKPQQTSRGETLAHWILGTAFALLMLGMWIFAQPCMPDTINH